MGDTVAIAVDKLLQTPPGVPVGFDRVVTAPEHTLSRPTIVPPIGGALTVTAWLAANDPQLNEDTV